MALVMISSLYQAGREELAQVLSEKTHWPILTREELQGVIAHEFSHILNGDMRINIRLMGTLFGILVLALIGRRILIHSRFVGGSSRNNGGAAIVLIAIGLTVAGGAAFLVASILLVFGRALAEFLAELRKHPLIFGLARCFENSLGFHRRIFDYEPSERVTVLLNLLNGQVKAKVPVSNITVLSA